MNFSLSNNIKEVGVIVISNVVLLMFVLYFSAARFETINTDELSLKLGTSTTRLSGLKNELAMLKNNQMLQEFDLDEQIKHFNTAVSNFKRLEINTDFKNNQSIEQGLGLIFGIKGKTDAITFLAYQLNLLIKSNKLKAKVMNLSMKANQAALTLKIYGVEK